MNWARYIRALSAQAIMNVEDKRLRLLGGHIKTMSAEEWEIVAENEDILRRHK